jgi:hypothetical protein
MCGGISQENVLQKSLDKDNIWPSENRAAMCFTILVPERCRRGKDIYVN